jgi:HSP20 family protein
MTRLFATWDPWQELADLQRQMNRLFSSRWPVRREAFPPVNLRAGDDGLVLTAEIPGVNPDELDVTIQRDLVTVRGRREAEPLEDGETYTRRERFTEPFSRTVELPFEVDPQQADAHYAHGVLTLKLSRPAEHKPTRVSVKTG